jgi:thioredoxin 1
MKFITHEDDVNLDGLHVLYFYASWMPYHKKMMIMIDKIEQKYDNIMFSAVDVDFFKNLCKRFTVASIPSIIVFHDGKEVKRITGMVLTSAFRSVFADICEDIGVSNVKEKNFKKSDQKNG